MRLLALPEDTLVEVLNTLQDLPFRQVYKLIGDVQSAKIVIDPQTKEPILVPEVTNEPAPTQEATPVPEATPAQ